MQAEKTQSQQAVANVEHSARKDWLTEKLKRADKFSNVILSLMEIYAELGEPFLSINPETNKCTFNLGEGLPVIWVSPEFADERKAAMEAAERIIESGSWAKAGISSTSIWEILVTLDPVSKRYLSIIFDDCHRWLISSIESQRKRCHQMSRLASPETGLSAIRAHVRADIFKAAIQGIDNCTDALSKLENAKAIIKDVKREWLDAGSRSRREAEDKLVELREKYLPEETPSDRARRIVRLLQAYDPGTKWNANSLRVRIYRKRS